jgi:CBS domain containing-hemolysin-like protein
VKFRVPVFERRIDNIVGIAYAMDMLDYVEQVEHAIFRF